MNHITCGACCRIPGYVFLNEDEPRRIAAFLKISEEEFIEKYCEISATRRRLVLKCNPDESCIMINGSNKCIIHEVKPSQCSGFPYTWQNSDSNELCPGMRECYK
jgi:Fe-S-cluster containining protein